VDYFRKIAAWLVESIFPPHCIGCSIVGSALCPTCVKGLKPRKSQECVACKKPTLAGMTCANCKRNTCLDQLAVAGHTDDELLLKAVHQLKYSYSQELAPTLTDWMLATLGRRHPIHLDTSPLVVPVPLHPKRLRERGFNQAELLARHIARTLAFEYAPDKLQRTRYTPSQVQTHSRWERLDNLRDAFTCQSDVAERDIILVDDICTTGATLDACAQALKSAGAHRVIGLVLARG
jgi:ComF family protein